MSGHWASFYLLLVCIVAYAALLPWALRAHGRLKNTTLGWSLGGLQIALLLVLVGVALNSHVRHERILRIESEQQAQAARLLTARKRLDALNAKRAILETKMDALNAATTAAEVSRDENALNILRGRRKELSVEQSQLLMETADLHRDVRGINKAYEDIRREINANK